MNKPVLFYFVHAHGAGHRATFRMLFPALSEFFTIIAITTNHDITEWLHARYDATVIELPPKYPPDYVIPDPTFSKAFEVTPYAIEPATRAAFLARIIEQYKPVAFYCDGVPEIAIMVRGMGVPVILVHLPGNTLADPTQVFAYELADHIFAHFPEPLEQPDYAYKDKTAYSGYLSQYAALDTETKPHHSDEITILMGYDTYDDATMAAITNTDFHFTIIGNTRTYAHGDNCRQLGRVDDIASAITGDIVITAAGQNTVAELLSLGKRLVLLPEPRPYDEQSLHAQMLIKHGVAVGARIGFRSDEWSDAIIRGRKLAADYTGLINKDGPKLVAKTIKIWYDNIS